MGKVKVLIVDDSAFMRKLISEFLAEDSRVEVIGTATNGRDAINIKTRCRNFGCGNADYGRIGSIKPDNE